MQHTIFEICERVAEAQALLHDYECGRHSAAEVVARLQALMTEVQLLHAMHAVGFFPPRSPMPENLD